MKLYESEAKAIFKKWGIPVPKCYGVVESAKDLAKLKIGFPAMMKAMVLIGGRGKAGGIKRAGTISEARSLAETLLKLNIKGFPVEKVMIEEIVPDASACYLGITIDPGSYDILILASPAGGVDIEETARTKPELILKMAISDNPKELPRAKANEVAMFMIKGHKPASKLKDRLAAIVQNLFALFQQCDCRVAEINPLFLTDSGPLAADAKIVIDDNGIFRQAALLESLGIHGARHDVAELTANEARALKSEFKYVDLIPANHTEKQGNIHVGLVPGGAGYGIFSIDEVVNIGKRFFEGKVVPVNFMDSGGGPTKARVAEMFHLLMDNPKVDCIITSRFGGISSCDIFIQGLIECLRTRHAAKNRMLPIYGRMVGTDLPNARKFLDKAMVETPEPLKELHIEVGNTKIMAEVIREGLAAFIGRKGKRV